MAMLVTRNDDFFGGQALSLLRQRSCGAASDAQMIADSLRTVLDTVLGVNSTLKVFQTKEFTSSPSETPSVGGGISVSSVTGLGQSGSAGFPSAAAIPKACSEASGFGS